MKPASKPAPRLDQVTLAEITPEVAAALLARWRGAAPIATGMRRYVDMLKGGRCELPGFIVVMCGELRSSPHRCAAIRDTGITGQVHVVHDGSWPPDFLPPMRNTVPAKSLKEILT